MSISKVSEIPRELLIAKNQEILEFLSDKYCHSDIVTDIEKVLSSYPDVKAFCPDGKSFKYCFWYAGSTIFACAHGMVDVWLRLPQPQSKTDRIKGAFEGNFSNESWWSFKYNYNDLEK